MHRLPHKLEKDSYWMSEPHLKGTTELITLFSGCIEVQVSEKHFIIKKEESIRFQADTVHSYRNIGQDTACLHMILYHP